MNGRALELTLQKKILKLAEGIRQISALGVISRQATESIVWKISFSQTSIVGRIGRSMMAPVYGKLNAPFFRPLHAGRERCTFWRRAEALPEVGLEG